MKHRCLRALAPLLAAAALVTSLAAPALATNPKPPATVQAGYDAHLGYKAQKTCSPSAKPGTKALLSALISTWGGSSWGISRMCSAGGTSEHKEGRALDWHMDVKYASQRARVNDALRWITANNGEVAYRLGIMYVIWNQRIWSIYYPELGWRPMASRGSYTANHKDHVHISLSWDGAMAQTSWWTGTLRTSPLMGPCSTGNYPACLPRVARADLRTWPTVTSVVPPSFLPHPGPIPNIGGSPQTGRTLTAVPGTWVPADATLTYAWQRDGSTIPDATGATYVVQAADVDKAIRVVVTATAGATVITKKSDEMTDTRRGVFTTVRPTITGEIKTDGVLTVEPGAWSPTPATYRYQWRRDGYAISGATLPTFTLRPTDVGHDISVTVTGSTPGFVTAARRSNHVYPVKATLTAAPVPVIEGELVAGGWLQAVPGEWAPAPVTLSYQWYRAGVAISGATAARYQVLSKDLGAALTVRVKGTKSGYVTAYRLSLPAGTPPPSPSPAPTPTSPAPTPSG